MHEWFETNSGWAPPDADELAEWIADGVCRCPDDCLVAPEAWCEHGLASWLLVLRALDPALTRRAELAALDPRQLVARGYDAIHETYARWTSADHDNLRTRYIDRVVDLGLVAADAAVLDLGCGTGAHATAYLAGRWRVVGTDISRQSVAVARQTLPSASFAVADIASVAFRPGSFGLITAFFSLIHVPRVHHAQVLHRIAHWLRPGGVVLLTMGAGDGGEDLADDWLGAPMYWSNWDRATNLRLLEDSGLEIVEANDETQDEDDVPVTFLWVLARKPAGFRAEVRAPHPEVAR